MAKIIFSTYDSINNPYYGGGGAIAIHNLATKLSKNFNVKIIAGSYPNSQDHIKNGVFYQFIGPKNLPPKLSQLIYFAILPFKVITTKFDIWLESFTPPFSTSCLQLFTNKPVVGVAHMLTGQDMKRKYLLPFDIFENIGLKTYKNIITTSEMFAKKIKQISPLTNVCVIANGIDKVRPIKYTGKYFLFVGRIEVNQKGLDLLVKALSSLKNEKLIICGSGDSKEISKLITQINKNRLQERVKLVGKKNHSEIIEIAKKAKAILVTSRFETFSIVALEALSIGVPLVSFDIDGLKWVPENSAVKVSPITSDALAKKLQEISESKIDTNSKVKNGLKLASKLTWDSLSKRYEDFIHQVINKNE